MRDLVASIKLHDACQKRECARELQRAEAQLSTANRRSKALHAKLEANKMTLPAYKVEMRKLQKALQDSAAYADERRCTLKRCEREALQLVRSVANAAPASEKRGAASKKLKKLKNVEKLTAKTYKAALGLL